MGTWQKGPKKHRTDRENPTVKSQINYRDPAIKLYTAYHALHDELTPKFYRSLPTNDRWPAGRNNDEYRTDQETTTGKAQRYHSDPVINLYTACRAPPDDSM